MKHLPNFEKLEEDRAYINSNIQLLREEVEKLEQEYKALTKQLSEKCLYDGHDWKQDSQGIGCGSYWSCRICHSAAPGRHYNRPDPWFNIPRKKRKRKPGKQLKVRVYRTGETYVIDH